MACVREQYGFKLWASCGGNAMPDTVALIFDPADLIEARLICEALEARRFEVLSYDPMLVGSRPTPGSRAEHFAALYDEKNLGCVLLVGKDLARNFYSRPDRPHLIRALRKKQTNIQVLLTSPNLDYFLDRDIEENEERDRNPIRLREFSYADIKVFDPAQIAEIYSKKRETFDRVIEGYNRVRDIVELALPNASITELSPRVSRGDYGIGYQIFEAVEEHLGNRQTYFIHLFNSIVLRNTADAIRSQYPDILGKRETVILLERSDLEQPTTRIRNVQRAFDTQNVQFIAEFVWALASRMSSLSISPGPESTDHEVFVPPRAYINGVEPSDELVRELLSWLVRRDSPILILTGPGGSGKTTLLTHLQDSLARKPQTHIHLISSRDVVEQFRKQPPAVDHLTLYELYVAQMRHNDEPLLEEKLFRLCLEQGQFQLLIDGLDEIISQLPPLWKDIVFLDSIINLASEAHDSPHFQLSYYYGRAGRDSR
jgi:thymidylate kinase